VQRQVHHGTGQALQELAAEHATIRPDRPCPVVSCAHSGAIARSLTSRRQPRSDGVS
jgi:hypothetical protein